MCEEMNIPFLGSIPLDPLIARSCDEGKSYVSQAPNSIASKAYEAIFNRTPPCRYTLQFTQETY